MKTILKKQLIIMLTLLLAATMFLSVIFLSSSKTTYAESQGKSAELVQTVSAYGQDWESSSFGQNGWFLLGPAEADPEGPDKYYFNTTVYSNLFTESADYDEETQSIVLKGFGTGTPSGSPSGRNGWFRTASEGSYIAADPSLNAPIDHIAFGARTLATNAVGKYGPYKPGTQETIGIRMEGYKLTKDVTTLIVNKTSDGPLYFTTYLFSQTPETVTPATPFDVYVYGGNPDNIDMDKDNPEGAMFYDPKEDFTLFGDRLYGKTHVAVSKAYLTFKLEGKGVFQIVASRGTDDEGNVIGTQAPYLGGFFLDNEVPEDFAGSASVADISESGSSEWERKYGNAGYAIAATDSDNNAIVYSNLYTQNTAYDSANKSISLVGQANGDDNTWLKTSDGKYIDASSDLNVPIDKWAVGARAWTNTSASDNIYCPGTTEPANGRLVGWKVNGLGDPAVYLEDVSIVINKTSEEDIYFTTYLQSSNKISADAPVDFYVYKVAKLTKNMQSTVDAYNWELCKTTVTEGGVFVTFLLQGQGEFQIVAAKGVDAAGNIIGQVAPQLSGFFLDYELPGLEFYDVAFVAGEGTTTNVNAKILSGEVITITDAIPTAAHTLFDGWYTTSTFDEGTKVTDSEYTVTGDVTFYAKYISEPMLTITYKPDGVEFVNDYHPDSFYAGEGTEDISPARKDGFTFEGWYLDEYYDVKVTKIPASVTESVTLYAKFVAIPVSHNITYVLGEGVENNANNPTSFVEGESVVLLPVEKEGFVFKGWYLNAEGTGEAVTSVGTNETSDVTLYAVFEAEVKVSFSVTIVHNIDGKEPTVIKVQSGEKLDVSALTAEGYLLEGLFYDAEFKNAYAKSTLVEEDFTLYAKWVTPVTDPVEDPDKNEPEVDDKGGCKSMAFGASAWVSVAIIAAVGIVLIKRKKNN